MNLDSALLELVEAAVNARDNAYCPYSEFAVGCAVRTTDNKVFTGCNVENASYSLTVCAERNAVSAAVAGGMKAGGLAAVAVAGGFGPLLTPCGACRQVIAEFAAPGCEIVCTGANGETKTYQLEDLLPDRFRLEG